MRFWLCMIAALAVSSAARAAPPLEAYGRLPAIERVVLSPSGDRFAVIGKVGSDRRLTVRQADGQGIYQANLGAINVRYLYWAGEDRIVVLTSQTVGAHSENLPLQVWSAGLDIDLKSNKLINIFHGSKSVVDAVFAWFGARQINGRWYAFVGAVPFDKVQAKMAGGNGRVYPDLYRVDLESGSYEPVAKAGLGRTDWVVGADGAVVAHATYDTRGKIQTLFWGASNDRPITSRAVADGKLELDGLGREPGTIILADRAVGEEEAREMRPSGAPDGEVLYSKVETAKALRDPISSQLIGIERSDGGAEFRDQSLQKRYLAAIRAFPDARSRLDGFTADLGRMLIYTDGAKDSGTYWLIDIAKKSARPIGDARPEIKPEDLGPSKMFAYKAGDGQALEGVLTLPPNRSAQGLPLVVLTNPRVAGPRSILRFDGWAQAFASQGYAVFQPNPRGTLGYGDTFRQRAEGEVGKRLQTDVSDAIVALAAAGMVDPKRVCISGEDYGGYVALASVTLQQGLYRCAVAISAPSHLQRFRSWAKERAGDDAVRMGELMAPVGPTGAEDLLTISPANYAARADAPVLLIHAAEDSVVPVEQSKSMAQVLKSAGRPVELIILDKEDHFLAKEETQVQVLAAAVAFVEKHNPPN
ncbi:S9 family peptidase [Phenylobacterium aquaticum]|uniref:alpha/beta hydrolase family protein n=1 Tax=Phenylobacterium aquaticum TaxID=1763816 RepID=UPI0026F1AF7F|nr:prolyl oligopeptidase family serine peptidase [Phenylobacterium aquaticum]